MTNLLIVSNQMTCFDANSFTLYVIIAKKFVMFVDHVERFEELLIQIVKNGRKRESLKRVKRNIKNK